MRNLPFSAFEHNQAWLELSLIAQDLLAQARLLCLDGALAVAEPKRLRQRLLHVAGRIVRSGRRTTMRLPRNWPWAEALVAAFRCLRALSAPSPP
jgi:Transposase DDE domain group 1